jgi:hypothetical protein
MRRNLRRMGWAMVFTMAASVSSVSNAQTPTPTPDQKPSVNSGKGSNDVPLSKKLNENEGVLKPPQGVDPQMHQEPPAKTGDKMPVIIPPGEPGGDQSVQPK